MKEKLMVKKKKRRKYSTARGIVHRETRYPDYEIYKKYKNEKEFSVKDFLRAIV